MIIRKRSVYESGQVLILIAALMIGLVAMVGLAVDGGGVYFLNRDLQNAVDAGVIAATYAKCTGGDVNYAATQAINDNGFVPGGPDNVVITVNNPPATGPGAGKAEYVEVIVQAEKPSYFIQVVNDDALVVRARSVGYCRESLNNTSGRALFATGENVCSNGVSLDISGSDVVVNGGVHSNDDMNTCPGCTVHGGASHNDGDGPFHGTFPDMPGGTPEDSGPKPVPVLFDPLDYGPGSAAANAVVAAGGQFLTFAPTGRGNPVATYIPADTDVPTLIYTTANITIKGTTATSGGTVYLTIIADNQATIDFTGNFGGSTFVNVGKAPGMPAENAVDYILAHSNADQSCPGGPGRDAMDFSGQSFNFEGIIYAPDGRVSMSGSSSDGSILGVVVARYIKLQGSTMEFTYDPDVLPPDPPDIAIAE